MKLTNSDQHEYRAVIKVCEGGTQVDQTSVTCKASEQSRHDTGKSDPGLGGRDILGEADGHAEQDHEESVGGQDWFYYLDALDHLKLETIGHHRRNGDAGE